MGLTLRGNYLFVEEGQKAFVVAMNFTNYLELGVRAVTQYYLEARIENNDFLIDAVLLDQRGNFLCELVRNKPKPNRGNGKIYRKTAYGFSIVNEQDQSHIFGVRIRQNRCLLEGIIYDGKGEVVAKSQGVDFLVYQGPAAIGKSGQSYGLVIR